MKMKRMPSWVNLLPLLAIAIVVVVVGVLAPKQPVHEVPFSAVVANKAAYVGYEVPEGQKLVFVDGIVLYREDGFCLVSGSQTPELPLDEGEYIIMSCRGYTSLLEVGDLIEVVDPRIVVETAEVDGVEQEVFYLGKNFSVDKVGHIDLGGEYAAKVGEIVVEAKTSPSFFGLVPIFWYFHVY